MSSRARYVHLRARPVDFPTAEDFAFVEAEVPTPSSGSALVENLYLSVDPYMRGLMNDGWPLGAPLDGRAIGRVIESRDERLSAGDLVFHWQGWRTHAVVEPDQVRVLPDVPGVPLLAYLSLLGGTGRTAYVGLARVARVQPGDTVFISAAAGGVGSAAGQIARLLGADRVIGSAGSPAKVQHLIETLGFDAAFDYHDGSVTELLAKAAPTGIDVYLDNVGGDHLEAALAAMRNYGRIAWCGAIAQYNTDEPPAAPRNLIEINHKQLRVEGFSVRDHESAQPELEDLLIPHIQSGDVALTETVLDGFDRVVEAFLGLFRGTNIGKTIVKVTRE